MCLEKSLHAKHCFCIVVNWRRDRSVIAKLYGHVHHHLQISKVDTGSQKAMRMTIVMITQSIGETTHVYENTLHAIFNTHGLNAIFNTWFKHYI